MQRKLVCIIATIFVLHVSSLVDSRHIMPFRKMSRSVLDRTSRFETNSADCWPNEHFVQCGIESHCEVSCTNLLTPPNCRISQHECTFPRCLCNEGFIRGFDRRCIREADCSLNPKQWHPDITTSDMTFTQAEPSKELVHESHIIECRANEIYHHCGKKCEQSCTDIILGSIKSIEECTCPKMPSPDCVCSHGYARTDTPDLACVHLTECQSSVAVDHPSLSTVTQETESITIQPTFQLEVETGALQEELTTHGADIFAVPTVDRTTVYYDDGDLETIAELESLDINETEKYNDFNETLTLESSENLEENVSSPVEINGSIESTEADVTSDASPEAVDGKKENIDKDIYGKHEKILKVALEEKVDEKSAGADETHVEVDEKDEADTYLEPKLGDDKEDEADTYLEPKLGDDKEEKVKSTKFEGAITNIIGTEKSTDITEDIILDKKESTDEKKMKMMESAEEDVSEIKKNKISADEVEEAEEISADEVKEAEEISADKVKEAEEISADEVKESEEISADYDEDIMKVDESMDIIADEKEETMTSTSDTSATTPVTLQPTFQLATDNGLLQHITLPSVDENGESSSRTEEEAAAAMVTDASAESERLNCSEKEVVNSCGSLCEASCQSALGFNVLCPLICNPPACVCNEHQLDLVRHNGVCIHKDQCGEEYCKENEHFVKCGQQEQNEVGECEKSWEQVLAGNGKEECPEAFCELNSDPGRCLCKPGFARLNQSCTSISQCHLNQTKHLNQWHNHNHNHLQTDQPTASMYSEDDDPVLLWQDCRAPKPTAMECLDPAVPDFQPKLPESNEGLRWYWNEKKWACMAFNWRLWQYPQMVNCTDRGRNMFHTRESCEQRCLPMDGPICVGQSAPIINVGQDNTIDDKTTEFPAPVDTELSCFDEGYGCPDGFVCKSGALIPSSCCNQTTEDYVDGAYKEGCPNGAKTLLTDYGQYSKAVFGDHCDLQLTGLVCPEAYQCVSVNPWFAKCCHITSAEEEKEMDIQHDEDETEMMSIEQVFSQ